MANYQGLNCIMGEITAMVADARYPHDQHIYDYFVATEKFVRTVVPQLFQDCMEQFKEKLVVEFETYLNGRQINDGNIAQGVAEVLQRAIDDAGQGIKICL